MRKILPLFAVFFLACSESSDSSTTAEMDPISSAEFSYAEVSSAFEETSSASLEISSASAGVLPDTVWNKANLTWYESYPDPGSEECIEYNGCLWAGYFAALDEQQTEEWVKANNIIAVHEKDFERYKLKTFRLRKNGAEIDAVVYDKCADSDCDGCCTRNAGSAGFLIDIEVNTRARFHNYGSGSVEWRCLDCEE